MSTRMATTAEEAMPEVSSQTISARQTILDISGIARIDVCMCANVRGCVYNAQTRRFRIHGRVCCVGN